jgi:hypothetical protein
VVSRSSSRRTRRSSLALAATSARSGLGAGVLVQQVELVGRAQQTRGARTGRGCRSAPGRSAVGSDTGTARPFTRATVRPERWMSRERMRAPSSKERPSPPTRRQGLGDSAVFGVEHALHVRLLAAGANQLRLRPCRPAPPPRRRSDSTCRRPSRPVRTFRPGVKETVSPSIVGEVGDAEFL